MQNFIPPPHSKSFLNLIKFIIVFFVNLILCTNYLQAQERYSTNAHQYVVRQAWEYLKLHQNDINWNATEMASNIGTDNYCGNDDDPWYDAGSISIGACREDLDDPVYGSDHWPGWNTTSTHFWKADDGDSWQFCPEPHPLFGCFENAYKKARAYIYGEHKIVIKHEGSEPGVPGGVVLGRIYSYTNLFDFYNTGHLFYWGYININGDYVEVYNPPEEIYISTETSKKWSYIILGRVAHLLEDMTVPAHVHGEQHDGTYLPLDAYENYISDEQTYPQWNYHLTPLGGPTNLGPEPLLYINNKFEPLRYLFYVTNQVADVFNSRGPGNRYYQSNYNGDDYSYYLAPIYASITTNDMNNYMRTADFSFCFGIKSVASLFYWFALNTNQIPQEPPHNLNITSNMVGNSSTGYTLFKGQTGYLYPNCEGEHLNYSWNYTLCNSTINGGWFFIDNTNNQLQILSAQSAITPSLPLNFQVNNLPNFTGGYCTSVSSPMFYFNPKVRISNYWNGIERAIYSDKIRINPSLVSGGGGCPYLYILGKDSSNQDSYLMDNNLLHRSEFNENVGQNITDLYHLKLKPNIVDGKINLQLFESEKDVNYFDQIKLYAIDHPAESKIGITEDNKIVMYYSADVVSTDSSTKNNENNITDYIQYNHPSQKIISGVSNDNFYIHYSSSSQKLMRTRIKGNSMSYALISEVGADRNIYIPKPIGQQKDWAGTIDINTNAGNFTQSFAKREMKSEIIIPYSGTNDMIDFININWNSDYVVSYFSIVPVYYDGFTKTELPLSKATHTLWNDVKMFLENIDEREVMMDTNSIIDLKFDNDTLISGNNIRDYVIEINGRYTNQANRMQINKIGHDRQEINSLPEIENIKEKVFQNKLSDNYPNPFNPITKIKYSLANPGFTKLEVYDILGRLVKVLVNEYKMPGNYIIEFNASEFSSGIYIYKLQSKEYIETKRMILLK